MIQKHHKSVKSEVEIGIVAISILLSMPLAVSFEEANADGRNAPSRLDCTDPKSPVLLENHKHNVTSETRFNEVIEVYQEFGECIYMSGNAAHLYTVPYMPLKYEVEVFDKQFPEESLHKVIITNIQDENFSFEIENLSVVVDYEIKVTSFFMDEDNVTEKRQSTISCSEEDPLQDF